MRSVKELERLNNSNQFSADMVQEIIQYANAGDVVAMRLLANCYGNGYYVEKNYAKRAQLLIQACRGGDVSAMLTAAYSIANGSGGFGKDESVAEELLLHAKQVILQRGNAYSDPVSAYAMGTFYYEGKAGLPKNFEKAYEFLSVSAKLGYSQSHIYLARMYQFGQYVPKNMAKARALLEQAVAMGNDIAAIELKYLR